MRIVPEESSLPERPFPAVRRPAPRNGNKRRGPLVPNGQEARGTYLERATLTGASLLPLRVPAPWSQCRESEKASRRDRRGRQLRLIVRAGPVLLWRGQSQRAGAGPDERRARR